MAFCNRCGKELAEDEKVCSDCYATFEEKEKVEAEVLVDGFSATDIADNKILSLFAYIGLLILIPVFAAKDSKYARFHINQGLLLIIASIILGVAVGIVSALTIWIPVIGLIISSVLSLAAEIIPFVFMIIGIVNAVTGKAKELPVIGKFRILK